MDRFRKSLTFWVILLVSVVVPSVAHAQRTVTKKTAWSAAIAVGDNRVGTASITRIVNCTVGTTGCVITSIEWKYKVQTSAYTCATQPCADGEVVVNKAAVSGSAFVRLLCEDDTCSYREEPNDGNLDLNTNFPSPPASLGDELDRGLVGIALNDGTLGTGTFVKTQNVVQ